MKTESTYKIYVTDTDGSERLGATVTAKSVKHARFIAKKLFGISFPVSIELQR